MTKAGVDRRKARQILLPLIKSTVANLESQDTNDALTGPYSRGDREAVERIAGYVIDRHFPEARNSERPILALLQSVAERQASLVAR